MVVADGYNQMPITGFKDLIGDNIGVLVTPSDRSLTRDQVVAPFIHQPGDLGIHQPDIDMLTLTGSVSVVKGSKNRCCGIESADYVSNGYSDLHGLTLRLSVQAHDPTIALSDEIITRQMGIGASLAKAGDRTVDEFGLIG